MPGFLPGLHRIANRDHTIATGSRNWPTFWVHLRLHNSLPPMFRRRRAKALVALAGLGGIAATNPADPPPTPPSPAPSEPADAAGSAVARTLIARVLKKRDGRRVRERRGFTILHVRRGRRVALRVEPDGRVFQRIGSRTEFGSPQTLTVADRRGRWLGVTSPARRNGRLAWVD